MNGMRRVETEVRAATAWGEEGAARGSQTGNVLSLWVKGDEGILSVFQVEKLKLMEVKRLFQSHNR